MFILIILGFNFCYSQESDKDIETIKKDIIGVWTFKKTLCKGVEQPKIWFGEKYHFKSKKVTLTISCPNKTIRKTFRYKITKKHSDEENKDIIVIEFFTNKQIPNHDDICLTGRKFPVYNYLNPVINNNVLTTLREYDPGCYDVLEKEINTDH